MSDRGREAKRELEIQNFYKQMNLLTIKPRKQKPKNRHMAREFALIV